MKLSIIIGHSNKDNFRERNLKYCLKYYGTKCPESEIIVVEQNTETDLSDFPLIKHIKIKTDNASYNRGLGFNIGYNNSTYNTLLLCDNDFLIDPIVLQNLERYMKLPYAYIPYNLCVNLSEKTTEKLIDTGRLGTDFIYRGGINSCVGGAMFISKDEYVKVGGFEEFKVHGGEDDCFFNKIKKISKIVRIKGEVRAFHLYHPNIPDKKHLISPEYLENLKILDEIQKMNKTQLLNYIKTKKI